MALMSLGELARVLAADVRGDARTTFNSVSTDSRTLTSGALFVALSGERFDGHDYLDRARDRGATAALIERAVDLDLPQLIVEDTRRALGLGAAHWRARFDVPVIAVAGSNGKTTVTQMIASILAAAHGDKGRLATRGNLNNEIGVPLMLWQLSKQHRAAVFELGMNHPGEIAWLAELVRPTVAAVTNAQREHLEFMQSVEATAHENGEVIAALDGDGVAVFPADDACAPIWRQYAGTRRVIDFSLDTSAVITATYRFEDAGTEISMATPSSVIDVRLAAKGQHNVRNALAATACSLAAGVDVAAIAAGLTAWRPVAGRGVRVQLAHGTVIDDTYNANPDSVRAAIELLASSPPPRVLVFGDMGELGPRAVDFHHEIGSYARERGIDAMLAIGPLAAEAVLAFGAHAQHFDDIDALIEAVRGALSSGTRGADSVTVLVKGSRFMRMERVVQAITQQVEQLH